MLVILWTFLMPINNNSSMQNSYADSVLLYTVHQVAGSDAISTDTLRKERCWVHVQIDVYSAHHGTFHRNNPDKTFYPGDAFDYATTTWKEGCGSFWQPCPIQSTDNNTVLNGPDCIKGVTYGSGSDSGTGVITPDYFTGSVSLSKKAIAEQYVCHKGGSGWSCSWNTVTASATQGIPMRLPNMTVEMWTVGEEFTEDAGYVSRNLDESYYVWDAINVVHNPIYEFKNDRVGTIFVEYEKIHDPLVLEDEFFCDAASCVNTMEVSGFHPWTGAFDYGGGNTVFNATSLDDIGEHEIKYVARLYNIVPKIDEFTQAIDELVVEYEPIYESYVYPVLADDGKVAFDDRIGYALHYFGNESTDANPDDEIGIHEDRRSKINDYFYSTWGADPWEFDFIDGTTLIVTDYSEDIQLTWDEANHVGIITNEVPVGKSVEIEDNLIPTEFPGITPYEVGEHGTANFLKAGYGKVKFSYDGLLDVVLDPVLKIPRYENATVYNTLESVNFAGHDVSFLTFDEYMYPESFFHNTVNVLAVDSEGMQDNSVEISLSVIPREEIDGTTHFDQYVHDKVLFDTDDDGFAQIITGLDMDGNDIIIVNDHDIHPLDNLAVEGAGKVSLEKTRRVLSSFTQYDTTINQTFDPNQIVDVSGKYLLDTEDGILPIPLSTGLDALSPYTISITANNDSIESTNAFEHTWYDFSIDYFYQLNMDDSNSLNIQRDSGNMKVLKYFYDENFGVLESLFINDVSYHDDKLPECFEVKSSGACYVSVPQDQQLAELKIVGINMWGGQSHITLPEITPEQLNPVSPNPINSIFNLTFFDFVSVLLTLMIVSYILYRTVRWYFATMVHQ